MYYSLNLDEIIIIKFSFMDMKIEIIYDSEIHQKKNESIRVN